MLQAGGTALASGNNAISGGAAFVQIDSSDFIIVQTDGLLYLNSSEARISNNANIAGTATIGNGAVVTGNTTINATGGVLPTLAVLHQSTLSWAPPVSQGQPTVLAPSHNWAPPASQEPHRSTAAVASTPRLVMRQTPLRFKVAPTPSPVPVTVCCPQAPTLSQR